MKIRYQLFLWVGSLFFLFFVASLYLENYLTSNSLKKAEKTLREEAVTLGEHKRQHYEEFLYLALMENQADINGLLRYVWEYQQLRENFEPTVEHLEQSTWPQSALLLTRNKWIEFLQNTNESSVSSLIIPTEAVYRAANKIPIEEGIAWVFLGSEYLPKDANLLTSYTFDHLSHNPPLPFIGVDVDVLPYFDVFGTSSFLKQEEAMADYHTFTLFTFDDVINFAKNVKLEEFILKSARAYADFTGKESVDIVSARFLDFFNRIQKAAVYVQKMIQETAGDPGKREQWFQALIAQNHLTEAHVSQSAALNYECARKTPIFSNLRYNNILREYEQLIMISEINSLLLTGYFGKTPQDPKAPKGVARFPRQEAWGRGFYSSDVFFSNPIFQDQIYYQEHSRDPRCEPLGSSIALIFDAARERLFLGNTLRLQSDISQEKREGYLTLGVQIGGILQKLSLAIHETTLLVYQGKPIIGFSKEGIEMEKVAFAQLPVAEMLNANTGCITFNHEGYFFLHMTPFKDVDLHVFSLNLEKREFSLIERIDVAGRAFLKKISLDMRLVAIAALLIALILLSHLSKKMTCPISILADAAEKIGKGHLQDVHIPAPPKGHADEIGTLWQAFDHMIQGLLQKEKVESVLNKVVSQEIAEEILKGNVHLGGEEHVVTVLFADIRRFTEMTQKMLPQDVIEMLNTCMTKISNVVDQYGGVIDKYVGDEVMALFGAPIYHEDSALQAVKSAIAMVDVLKIWNEERLQKKEPIIEMGIGIHTGRVVVGNMGAENRLNYTVLGSGVNLSSRLCTAAEGMEILISQGTLEAPFVKEKINVEERPPMMFKGFDEPIPVFRVKGIK